MPMFDYISFRCPETDLQPLLKQHGLERWRLHTCEPVMAIGPHGSGILEIFVVMDQIIEEPEEEQITLEDGASQGLAMSNPRT